MYVGESYPVYYRAVSSKTGLLNIKLLIRRPDNVIEGLFTMNEFDSVNHKGRYLYEYTPPIEGEYLFTVYENGSADYSKSEFFRTRDEKLPFVSFDN